MSSKSGAGDTVEVTIERLSLKLEQLEEQITAQSQELDDLKGMIPDTNIIKMRGSFLHLC